MMQNISRFENILNITGTELRPDPWGSAMGLFFDVALVLDASDVAGDVTPQPFERWQYRRAAARAIPDIESIAEQGTDYSSSPDQYNDDYTYAAVMLAAAYVAGDITQTDLIYAGDVLNRYTELLRKAGKDY